MAQNVVPFGKYKGQPVEVLAEDREYTDWLMGQSWFRDRYQNIYTLIINNFTEASETPEHNALQVLFLDEVFAQWVVFLCYREVVADAMAEAVKEWEERRDRYIAAKFNDYGDAPTFKWAVNFEYAGIDVLIECRHVGSFKVEIKPSLGDDYPAVMRQIKNIKYSGKRILFIERYSGAGATYEQVVEIFRRSGIKIVTLAEVRRAMEDDNGES